MARQGTPSKIGRAARDAGRRHTPRQLAIDLAELAYAIENGTWEMPYFLDLDTGKLIFIIDEVRGQYNALAESLSEVDLAQWTQAFEAALAELHLPERKRLGWSLTYKGAI